MHQLPIIIEKDEFGYYAYCSPLERCHLPVSFYSV